MFHLFEGLQFSHKYLFGFFHKSSPNGRGGHISGHPRTKRPLSSFNIVTSTIRHEAIFNNHVILSHIFLMKHILLFLYKREQLDIQYDQCSGLSLNMAQDHSFVHQVMGLQRLSW